MQIAVDLGLILRCSAALLWGVLWACAIQFSRLGKFLATERTWIVVVIGVGVDLLLGIGAAWWVFWLITAFSSIGIIARSLINEHEYNPDVNSYKHKWSLEDAIDHIGDTIGYLEQALEPTGWTNPTRMSAGPCRRCTRRDGLSRLRDMGNRRRKSKS